MQSAIPNTTALYTAVAPSDGAKFKCMCWRCFYISNDQLGEFVDYALEYAYSRNDFLASSSDLTKVLTVSLNGGVNILTSIDSCATWTARSSSGTRTSQGFARSSDGTKVAGIGFNDYIYTSIDTGVTWLGRTTSGQRNWQTICSSTDGVKIAATVDSGYIYVSGDSGATWTQCTSGGSRAWRGISCSSDGTKLLAAVTNGNLYTSIDTEGVRVERLPLLAAHAR